MSNYKIIINPEELDYNEWSDFVFNHPYGNAFQTPEMYNAYKNTPLYEPVFISVKDNEKILGILLAVVQKEYPLPFGFISSRSIIWGGPLVIDNDIKILNLILKEYDNIASKKAIYSQFRNFWEQDNSAISVFNNNGFFYQEHLNIIVDLTLDENELWKNIDQRKRTYINKAKKEGLTFNISTTNDQLTKCYSILKDVYKKAKLPLPQFLFFKTLLNTSNHLFKFIPFIISYNNEIISCFFGLCYKSRIYEYYVGNNPIYLKKNGGDLLLWEIFNWGKANGYSIFDFGGAGKSNLPYGVRDYKKKFGGEIVEYGRYEKIHHPLLMKIATIGFKVWQKIKF